VKPVIHVYHCHQIKDTSCIKQLLFGMEEEGVPCFIEAREERTAQELGYKAAESSNLGVGVGIGEDGTVVLHYNKLKQEEPLFLTSLHGGRTALRALGANAARLVKGVPFKSMSAEAEENEESSGKEMEYLTAVILNRINDLLQDKGGAGFA